ncbi:MAG: methyltransferase domain-containing protein [Cyanobacteria bacterium SZAS-4]|nr:methyltransferase domain-containing protein [Cyanobacteria bacterium SZAS-4]
MTSSNEIGIQSRFSGLSRVILFNWPLYVAALLVVVGLFVISILPSVDTLVSKIAMLILVAVLLQTFASLIASHWVYDLSPLRDWSWLAKAVGEPQRIVLVHAGYDETGGKLAKIFPSSEIQTVDFYAALERREPSIIRAQKFFPSKTVPISSSLTNWPVPNDSVDLVLVAFAAHEVRDHEKRVVLFQEMRRILAGNGHVMLVEHLRDRANFIAYGIGAFHFLSNADWVSCTEAANLLLQTQFKITPFVRVYELCR